jgi:hypothetical protein
LRKEEKEKKEGKGERRSGRFLKKKRKCKYAGPKKEPYGPD